RSEALRMLRGKIAVRHRMTDHDGIPAELAKLGGNPPRDRALAASGADGADRDDRHFGDQLRAFDAQQAEIGARGDVGNLGCGESDYVKFRVVSKNYVEVVEVSSSGSQDKHSLHSA